MAAKILPPTNATIAAKKGERGTRGTRGKGMSSFHITRRGGFEWKSGCSLFLVGKVKAFRERGEAFYFPIYNWTYIYVYNGYIYIYIYICCPSFYMFSSRRAADRLRSSKEGSGSFLLREFLLESVILALSLPNLSPDSFCRRT